MADEKDKSLTPTMLKARNEILVQFGDHTFDQALDEVKTSLSDEKYSSTRLALFAARSWIIRNKIYAKRSQYISIKNPLHKQSEKACMCF